MARKSKSGRSLQQRLDHLRGNRTSGAIDLALEAIDLAQGWIAEGGELEELACKLRSLHPAIATVANVGRLLREERGDLASRLSEVRESLLQGNRRIAENLRSLIGPAATVITLSNSSTVRDVLITLGVGSVLVLESQPGGEGAQMAEALRSGLQEAAEDTGRRPEPRIVRLIPDSAMGNVVPSADCALTGIDSFDRSGAIVHKVGTLPLALCCRHFQKPFYAAGHSFKAVDREFSGLPEPDKTPEDQLFDCTPRELITRLVTEMGPA